MPPRDDLPVLPFASKEEFANWLEENHESADGLWLKIAKKDTGIDTVTHLEALDVALCHGWIDGQRQKHDDTWFLQRFTPRKARSRWSRINRDKAIVLIEAGRMTPPGLAAVDQAKADGRWERAYEGAATITVPDDLQRALDANAEAAAAFATLDGSNRYAVLYRIGDAKKPETRARRIEQYVAMLARGEALHPRRGENRFS
jgi:uncharacterized protein YdeI (YjbR/CyaY-like superfamily)